MRRRKEMQRAAQVLGLRLIVPNVRAPAEIDTAFATTFPDEAGALTAQVATLKNVTSWQRDRHMVDRKFVVTSGSSMTDDVIGAACIACSKTSPNEEMIRRSLLRA
jgi:hypothetical protein